MSWSTKFPKLTEKERKALNKYLDKHLSNVGFVYKIQLKNKERLANDIRRTY